MGGCSFTAHALFGLTAHDLDTITWEVLQHSSRTVTGGDSYALCSQIVGTVLPFSPPRWP